jgi:hypothetical protein
MTSNDELASIAHSSAFIFTADIIGPTGGATDTDERTVTALVRDVMKVRPACVVSRVAAPGGSSCAMPRRRRPFRHAE